MVWKRNEVMKQENRLDSDESRRFLVERAMGIEPTSSAWKADILPMNYTCVFGLIWNNAFCSLRFLL